MIKSIYLAIQSTYQTVDIALFDGSSILDSRFYSDIRASTYLVSYIDSFLTEHKKTLNDLSFIAIDKGPGAFTTLRVAIATINGIAFAKSIPLVGVDGLEALHFELLSNFSLDKKDAPVICISILNAYNNDVYFIYSLVDGDIITKLGYGCKKIDLFINELSLSSCAKNLFFNGNGFGLHQELIEKSLGSQFSIKSKQGSVASSKAIASLGYNLFNNKENISSKIVPNYIKTQLFALKKTT